MRELPRLILIMPLLLTIFFGESAFIIVLLVTLFLATLNPYLFLPLFFFSGIIKNSSMVQLFPIDFTVLTLIGTLLWYAYHYIILAKGKIKSSHVLINLILIMMIFSTIISLIITPATWEFIKNSGVMLLVVYLPISIVIINAPETIKVERIVKSFLTITYLIGFGWTGIAINNKINGIAMYSLNFNEPIYYLSAFGETYMIFSVFTVCLFLIVFLEVILERRNLILNSSLLIFLTYCLINSPARSLTLGLIVTILILSTTLLSWKLIFQFVGIGTIALIVLMVYFRNFNEEFFFDHLNRLFDYSTSGKSVNDRFTFINVGFKAWLSSGGLGTGSDSIAFINGDPGAHVHNFILEVLFEHGLVGSIGFILYFLISGICAYSIFKKALLTRKLSAYWLCGMFLIFFTFGFFSGSLGQMRFQWILFALVIWVADEKLTFSKNEFQIKST